MDRGFVRLGGLRSRKESCGSGDGAENCMAWSICIIDDLTFLEVIGQQPCRA